MTLADIDFWMPIIRPHKKIGQRIVDYHFERKFTVSQEFHSWFLSSHVLIRNYFLSLSFHFVRKSLSLSLLLLLSLSLSLLLFKLNLTLLSSPVLFDFTCIVWLEKPLHPDLVYIDVFVSLANHIKRTRKRKFDCYKMRGFGSIRC